MFQGNLLSYMIWLPILGAIGVLLTGNDRGANKARLIALSVSLISLALCVPLLMKFDMSNVGMQFVEVSAWIPSYHADYSLGVDGLSISLIVLTSFTTLIVILAAWRLVQHQVCQYLASFLLLQGLMVGVFAATNALLFYMFWEAMLIPMYLIIGIWGSSERSYAAIKFFLYTFLGSALMLAAMIFLALQANDFSIQAFYHLPLSKMAQLLIFGAFFMAFAVKVPMWPVHTWLPDAHTEAPAGGSVILAAILLKMGAYGFLRFVMPIVPDACRLLAPMMVGLSLVAIIYIGLVAIVQKDMKRLIAYSSIAHMGIVTLGCFLIYFYQDFATAKRMSIALDGAVIQMISHAFTSGAMFIIVGMLYDRMHTRLIHDYGGVVHSMPMLASFFMLFAMANVGLPATSGFVGEFMVLLGAIQANFWLAFAAGFTLILSASYTLWMYKRVFFGPIGNKQVAMLTDIDGIEWLVLLLLAIPVLVVGIYPKLLLQLFHPCMDKLLQLSLISKLT